MLDFEKVFPELVGNFPAKLAVVLNLIEPRCGGVVLFGKKGVGKSLLLKLVKKYFLINNIPFVEIPLNATEENLTGGIDIEKTLEVGKKVYQKGLLEKAKGKFVLVDNINLLSPDIQSLLFQKVQEFTLIASLNPDEGTISPHFLDKVGMCAFLSKLEKKEELEKLFKIFQSLEQLDTAFIKEYESLFSWIKFLKKSLNELSVSESVMDYIVNLCQKNGVSSHRGEIFLYFASKAFCALKGDLILKEEHISYVAPLVLVHRAKKLEEKPISKDEKPEKKEEKEKNNEFKQKPPNKKEPKPQKSQGSKSGSNKKDEEKEEADEKVKIPALQKEEVFSIGEIFKLRQFIFKKDRVIRNTGGRRTKSKTLVKGARFVRSVLFSKDKDIDIFGTLKTAAPFQKIRGRKDKVIIYEEDLRFKEKEKKVGHLVVFVVDGSGSMAARQRMLATKGAIFSLLMDCYQKRERVAMILFRKFSAEVVLPPTNSVTLAYKKLKELPTGGNTPLSAGLFEAYQLIKKHHLKFPYDRVILLLLTDGRGNIPIKPREDPMKETKNLCYSLKELWYVDPVVIDTEIKDDVLRFDLAKELAEWLDAKYFCLEELKSESLVSIVKNMFYQKSFS